MVSWWNSLELSGLEHVYLVCFLAGLVLLVLDILLGSVSGLLNLDLGVDVGADLDLDMDLDMDMDLDVDGVGTASWLPLQPMCILAGVTVFGGVGAGAVRDLSGGLARLARGGSGGAARTGHSLWRRPSGAQTAQEQPR